MKLSTNWNCDEKNVSEIGPWSAAGGNNAVVLCMLTAAFHLVRRDFGLLVPKTSRTQDSSYLRQLVPKTSRTQDDSYPRQLVPKTTPYPGQLVPTQGDSHPGQLVHKTTRTETQGNSCSKGLEPKTNRTQDKFYPNQLVFFRLVKNKKRLKSSHMVLIFFLYKMRFFNQVHRLGNSQQNRPTDNSSKVSGTKVVFRGEMYCEFFMWWIILELLIFRFFVFFSVINA